MRVTLAFFLYLGSLSFLFMGAFLAAPSAADPEKFMKYMLVTLIVQLASACYLFTCNPIKKEKE